MRSTITRFVLVAGGFLGSISLTSCVSQSEYDTLAAENAQLHNTVTRQGTELAHTRSQLADTQGQFARTQGQLAESRGETTRLQGAIKYTVDSDLLFESGSWEMSDKGKDVITKMAKKLAPSQRNKLVVNGYTDNAPIGEQLAEKGIESNRELSEKRAEAVRDFLISTGVSPNQVIAVGHGEDSPVAPNETAKGRSQNRRVELTLGG